MNWSNSYVVHIVFLTEKPTGPGITLTVLREPQSHLATASWPEPQGYYTKIVIVVCNEQIGECLHQSVNMSVSRTTTQIRNLAGDTVYSYTLRLYDGDDQVYASRAVKSEAPVTSGYSMSKHILTVTAQSNCEHFDHSDIIIAGKSHVRQI